MLIFQNFNFQFLYIFFNFSTNKYEEFYFINFGMTDKSK